MGGNEVCRNPWAVRGCLKSERDRLGPKLVIARNNSLSYGPERCSVDAACTSLAGTAARWTPTHNRASCHPERDLLSAAHWLPMATPSARVPGLGHRLSLLPYLEEHGRVDRHPTNSVRASSKGSRSLCLSICGDHGRTVRENNGARRSSWLRCAQVRQGTQTSHPRRHLGLANRLPCRAGQHVGSASSLVAPRWIEPVVSSHSKP